jgi:hypothetical protein
MVRFRNFSPHRVNRVARLLARDQIAVPLTSSKRYDLESTLSQAEFCEIERWQDKSGSQPGDRHAYLANRRTLNEIGRPTTTMCTSSPRITS